MLLRSTSSPILRTYASKLSSTPEPDPPARPVSLCLKRTSSEGELKLFSVAGKGKTLSSKSPARSPVIAEEKEETNMCMETASSSLHSGTPVALEGGGGGGGLGSGGGGGGGWSSWDSGHMDMYYQSMIKTYPGDALLLANYAKFLKEVRGDDVKAEELCERAILTNGDDGNVLSMYGDLIWNNHKDGARAQTYFDRAVHSSPDDCYVLASYARFLWDADKEEDEEEEEEGNKKKEFQSSSLSTCAPLYHNLSHGQHASSFDINIF